MLSWLRKRIVGKPSSGKIAPAGFHEMKKADDESTAPSTHRPSVMSEKMGVVRRLKLEALFPRAPQFKKLDANGFATDEAIAMDECMSSAYRLQPTVLPDGIYLWYMSQTFIGWQACATMAQNWFIQKACLMPGKDAAQPGWKLTANDGNKITPQQLEKFNKADKKYKVMKNLVQAHFFREVFGIRHVLFKFDGMDYSLPFNPDSIRPGTFRGMVQIDPYWLAPQMDGESTRNPASEDFYEPAFWSINGVKYHKSHFVILTGPEVADILKPGYMYGGSPLPQRLYERVYAAERTANEAPELAMTKRLTVRKTDLEKAVANQEAFQEAIEFMVQHRNNNGIVIAGTEEEIQQLETSLADMDALIMTQFQLACAEAEIPATKMLGTSPKGFGASGDYEIQSYHERCGGIQENDFMRILERYYEAVIRSDIPEVKSIVAVFNPMKQLTAQEIADIANKNADTDSKLQATGAISGYDIRERIASDEYSGYTGVEVPDEMQEGGNELNVDPEVDDGSDDDNEAESQEIPKP